MAECSCPENWKAIPPDRRVTLVEPDSHRIVDNVRVVDKSKVHVWHADCPIHGFSEIDKEVENGV
jgi:hypothetical protein